MSKKQLSEEPALETPAAEEVAVTTAMVPDKILTVSEHAKLSPAEQEEFRRNNGTVTSDPS